MALIFTDLGENAFSLLPLSMIWAIDFFIDGINQIEEFSPSLCLLRVLSWIGTKFY